MSLDWLLQASSIFGLPALALAVVWAILNRRRHRVDRAEVIEGITVRVAERLDKDVATLHTRLEAAQQKVDDLVRQLDASQERERRHLAALEEAEARAVELRRRNAELEDELARKRRQRGG